MILERTQDGINEAREEGVKFGRKSKTYKIEGALLHAIEMVGHGEMSQSKQRNMQSVVSLHLKDV